MGQIIWSDAARDDLKEIHDYIARDSFHFAQLTVDRICDATWRLRDFAPTGARLVEFPDSPYREIYWRKYRIIYRHDRDGDRVYIVGIIHGARHLPDILPDRISDEEE